MDVAEAGQAHTTVKDDVGERCQKLFQDFLEEWVARNRSKTRASIFPSFSTSWQWQDEMIKYNWDYLPFDFFEVPMYPGAARVWFLLTGYEVCLLWLIWARLPYMTWGETPRDRRGDYLINHCFVFLSYHHARDHQGLLLSVGSELAH